MKRIVVLFVLSFCVAIPFAFAEEGKSYTVKKGDTFSSICLEQMESGAERICKREAKRLGLKNPDLIYPGQILHFPYVYRLTWEPEGEILPCTEWFINKNIIIKFIERGKKKYPSLGIEKK